MHLKMTTRARAFYLLKKSDKSDFIRLFKSDFIRLFKIRSTALVCTPPETIPSEVPQHTGVLHPVHQRAAPEGSAGSRDGGDDRTLPGCREHAFAGKSNKPYLIKMKSNSHKEENIKRT